MQRSLRRRGAVQSYACQLVRSYAAESKGSGRYPHLQEPGKPAKPSVQNTPGNPASPSTGGAGSSNSSKTASAVKPKDSSATAANPGNHAYPPTAGASSGAKPSKPASEGTSPVSAGSGSTYTPQGKDAKANQVGNPKDKSSATSSPASQGQGETKGPPGYKPAGASAPLNATGGSSSKPSPATAGAAGNHAYPPTAGASASSSGRGPPSGPPPSSQPPPEPLPGGRNKWRLHPYLPVDVRLLSAALLGLGAYYFYLSPSTSDQHQPNAGDGRIFGSPDSMEPDPKQLDDPEGEPIPLDMNAVAKHAQRLDQRSNSNSTGKGGEQHQPNAGDGRVLGSSDSQEPSPKQDDGGEPLPFDEGAAAKHAKRLQQRSKGSSGAEQHQPNAGDGRVLGSSNSQEPEPQLRDDGQPLPFDDNVAAQHAKRLSGNPKQQHQPNAGDGRVFGSSDSTEPNPEELDNGEHLPVDDRAVAQHAQRLAQRSNQHQSPDAGEHQPSAGDGRVFGSEQSREPKPEQRADGQPLPLDLDAVDKHQQRLQAAGEKQEASQHQPRVGDGRKMGSPESKEPEPVVLDNGEPLPLDKEAVARHQRRLEERVKQDQARHENAHDDEFAISGGAGDKRSDDTKAGKGKGKDDKPVYVDPTPLAALFQEALGGSSGHAPAQTDQPKKSDTSSETKIDDAAGDVKKSAQKGIKSVEQKAEDVTDSAKSGAKSAADSARDGANTARQKAEEVKKSAKSSADSAADSAKSGIKSAKQKADDVKDSAKSGAKSAADSATAGASTAKQKAEELKDSAKQSADSVADSVRSGVKSAKQKAEDMKDSAKSGAKSAADSAKAGANTAREKAEELKDSAKSAADSAADSAKAGVKSAKQKTEYMKDSAKSGASTARQKAEEVKDSAKQSADSIADSVKSGVKSAKQTTEDLKDSTKSGASAGRQKAEEVKDSAKSAADSAKSGAKSAGQKAGEVKDSAKSGAKSAADSAKAGASTAKQKAEEVTDSAKSSAESAADSVKSGVESAGQKDVKDSAKSGAKSAADSTKAGASTARQKAEEVKDSAKSSADSAADSAKSGVKSAKQKVEEVQESAKSGAHPPADAGRRKAEEGRDSGKSAADSAGDSAKAGAKAAGQKAEEAKGAVKAGAESAGGKAKEAKESAKASGKSAAGKAGELAGSAKSGVESTAKNTAAAVEEGGAGVKRKGRAAMDEAMHVVKESMTDIGGLGYFHEKTPKSKDEDLPAPKGRDNDLEEEVEKQSSPQQAQQTAVGGVQHLIESHGPAADLPSRPVLGIAEDLSGAALVRRAIERGKGARDNWAEFKYRHRQAEEDSQLLYATLKQAEQFHQAEVERLEQVVNAEAARGDYILEAAQDNIQAFAGALDQQAERHQRKKQAELQRQRQALARIAAEELVQERRQRMAALKEIRRKLRSLEGLLQFRGNEQDISHTAHKLSIGTFALQTALDKGAPFETELEYLAEGCQGDPLVQSAVLSFQQHTALKGIPTRAQLVDRWAAVSRAARQLSTIPQGQGGPLSIAVATLASALKLQEDSPIPGPQGLSQGGIETHLAYAEACLVNGQLSTAASHIQKLVQGTEAAPLVQDWVKATQTRAVAEQTSALLQAHAATLAASLSQS